MSQKIQPITAMLAPLAFIDPDAYGAGTVTSGWLSMADFLQAMILITVGDMAAGSTVDLKVEQATDAGGTGVKDITGALITQLTQAGADDNSQAVIELWPEDLDANNDFTHVRMSMTVAVATSDAAVVLFGSSPRYGKAADLAPASLLEIVGPV